MGMHKRDFGYYVSTFLSDYLPAKKGCATKTVRSYRDALVLFIEFMQRRAGKKIALFAIDAATVETFLDYLESERGNSIATRNHRQAALNSFLSFVRTREPSLYNQITEVLEIPRKKASKPTVAYLTVAELETLFASVDESKRTGLRDKTMLAFLYETAARVEELTGCVTCQLRFDSSPYVELHGKGGKMRNVPVTESFAGLVEDYMDTFDMACGNIPLFANRYGQPLTQKGVAYVLSKYLVVAARSAPSIGRKHNTCHSLRQYGESYKLVSD
jgi:site-specific recombinase XerD